MSSTNKVVELVDIDSISIHQYVIEDNIQGLTLCLNTKLGKIDSLNEYEQTALHVACELGKTEFASLLLANGANVHAADCNGTTPLIAAVKCGATACVDLCIAWNAKIEANDDIGWTPLMWAAYKGCTDVFKILINKDASISVTSAFNMNPLLWAAGRGFYDIVDILCHKSAKINATDKFGSNALYWACRKGFTNVVSRLLDFGADADAVGANGANSLIVCAKYKHVDCVDLLLTRTKVNTNQTDKDSNSALIYSAKLGSHKSVMMLLERGAYLSMTDQHGDTPLIKAVKHGHLLCVKELLAHYADVNVKGKNGKTALHWACETGHVAITKELLACDPDTEIMTDDGETVLIRAVKNKNVTLTRILLDKGANVAATDSKLDTAIHIAVRARSMRLVEILLRNPSDSRLLYVPNKKGETPYNMDAAHNKSILLNIFGSKNLSPETLMENDDSTLQSYTLYSSALADILCEPTLSAPLTVGLYAKWGSGKSFLLQKLKDQIKVFTSAEKPKRFSLSFYPFLFIAIIATVLGLLVSFLSAKEQRTTAGLTLSFSLFGCYCIFIGLVALGNTAFKWKWAKSLGTNLTTSKQYLWLLWRLWFTNPHFQSISGSGKAIPVRFLFTNYNRLTAVGGETSLAEMIGALSYSAEKHLGFLAVRLYRAIKPEFQRHRYKEGSFKMLCCVPTFLLAMIFFASMCTVFILTAARYGPNPAYEDNDKPDIMFYFIIILSCLCGVLIILSLPLIYRVVDAVIFSQRHRVLGAAHNTQSSERLMQQLKNEVDLLGETVMAIDAVAHKQTRLCVIVNGLDSCEQDKVLQVLDAVNVLFAQRKYRFIVLLAIDPKIIIKAIDNDLKSAFRDSSITGHDYLKNIIHLPFYMRDKNNKLIRKHKSLMKVFESDGDSEEENNLRRTGNIHKAARTSSRRKKNFDLLRDIFAEDWFNSISPQLMKRILNIVSLTGRLLRAEGIEFTWSRLAAWVNLTEQWPVHASWAINVIEAKDIRGPILLRTIFEENSFPLNEPLLRIESSDERSFHNFLSGRHITAHDVRAYLACTVNLDPNLREIIMSGVCNCDTTTMPSGQSSPSAPYANSTMPYRRKKSIAKENSGLSSMSYDKTTTLPAEEWTIDDVIMNMNALTGLSTNFKEVLTNFIRENNLHGSALLACELSELRNELPHVPFGDWSIFKRWLINIRNSNNHAAVSPAIIEEENFQRKSFAKHSPQAHSVKSENAISDESSNNKMMVLSLESLQFESLRAQDKFAYDSAFKEYLKLHPTSSGNNSARESSLPTVSQQIPERHRDQENTEI